MTDKERNLLKGAIRRVFSRSDIRRAVLNASVVTGYRDADRPRVTKWSKCAICKGFTPTYKTQVDHIDPVIPISETLANMSWDTVIDRQWCKENNLQVCCLECHKQKTKAESKERRKLRPPKPRTRKAKP